MTERQPDRPPFYQDFVYDMVHCDPMKGRSGVSHSSCIENARRAYLRAAECSDPVYKAELTKIAELWGQIAERARAEAQIETSAHASQHGWHRAPV